MGNLCPARLKTNDSDSKPNDDDKGEIVDPGDVVLLERQAYALYSFNARNADELSFEKNTEFELLEDVVDMKKDWILARIVDTRQEGFIPLQYVQCRAESPQLHPAWYDIIRNVAVRKLMIPGLQAGTYLIRPCSKNPNWLALSIRATRDDGDPYVRHHFIKIFGAQYYIVKLKCFDTVNQLLEYHSSVANITLVRLTQILTKNLRPPVRFNELDINRERIVLERRLGAGAFGEVFLGRWNRQMTVAVKSLKMKDNLTEKDRNDFLEEAKIMHRLSHPHIVQILAVCTKPMDQPMLILTEFMEEGCLKDFLVKDLGEKVKLDDLINMMHHICDGMEYLGENNLIHRDLRAANILVDADWTAKVADFGLSREDEYNFEKNPKFPIRWTPLEAMRENDFSPKSDVYSFGIVMYEMVTYGGTPYANIQRSDLQSKLEKGYCMPNPHGMEKSNSQKVICPNEIYETMKSCWNIKPFERPTFSYLKNYFENVDVTTEEQYLDS